MNNRNKQGNQRTENRMNDESAQNTREAFCPMGRRNDRGFGDSSRDFFQPHNQLL